MQCTILNRNYPPNPGITGGSANELAEHLSAAGIEVHVVTVGGKYQGGGALNVGVHGQVHQLKSFYHGKNKILRLISSLAEGWAMARKAFALGHSPCIAMTDPPLLNFWVARKARRRKLPWIYWSMDLYPEAFVAGNLVSGRNLAYRFIKKSLLAHLPSAVVALGPNHLKFIETDYATPLADKVLLPCGISNTATEGDAPPWLSVQEGRILFGYIGNVGEAHDVTFIKSVMDHIDPEKHSFILVAYGAKSQELLAHAASRKGVMVLDRVNRTDLKHIDVHLVTLLPSWDHICVPSKAVSAVCEGGSVLMCCSNSNDNWELLQDASWRIEPDGDCEVQVQAFFDELTYDRVKQARANASKVSKDLNLQKAEAFEAIASLVKKLND